MDRDEGYYNRVRMHRAIGFMAPVTKESSLLAACLGVRGNEAGSKCMKINTLQLKTLFALSNLRMVRHQLLQAQGWISPGFLDISEPQT